MTAQGPQRKRGQALVEIALVAPVLCLILLALLEFGWYFYYLANLNNASRLGARVGAACTLSTNNDAAVTAAVTGALGSMASQATISIYEFTSTTVDSCDPAFPPISSAVVSNPRATGDFLVVFVSIPYNSMTRFVDLNQIAGISSIHDYTTFPINP